VGIDQVIDIYGYFIFVIFGTPLATIKEDSLLYMFWQVPDTHTLRAAGLQPFFYLGD